MATSTDTRPELARNADAAERLQVGMGRPLPPQAAQVPLLRPQPAAPTTAPLTAPTTAAAASAAPALAARPRGEAVPTCTTLAQGLHFVGTVRLTGACNIGGLFEGTISQLPGTPASVVISETGRLKGNVHAHKISVMGEVEGLIDAGHGEVSLHDHARVSGKVRYGRIVVNGADLNATLERVSPPSARR